MNTLKITQNNSFVIYVPLVVLNSWGEEHIIPTLITDLAASVKMPFRESITITPSVVSNFVILQFDKNLKVGKYDATISFKYEGRDVAKNIKDLFEIVEYDRQSNWRDYIVGDHVELCTQAFIAGSFLTDEDYERLKAELSAAISAAEQAKAEYIRKAQELDGVAQQGNNPNATNTAIYSKIGTAADGQPATLFEAIAAAAGGSDSGVALIVERMRAAGVDVPADATLTQVYNKLGQYLPLVAAGSEFAEDMPTLNWGDIFVNPTILQGKIKVINAPTATNYNTDTILNLRPTLQILYMPNVVNVTHNNRGILEGWTMITHADFRSIVSIAYNSYLFYNCTNLIKLNISSMNLFGSSVFSNCTKLIDLIAGVNFNSNITLSGYNPTDAMSNTSSSLCFDTDLQEYGRVFNNNREKWNWCLREHFAANLPNRIGLETTYTITFGSAVLAKFEQATIDAFTDNGWNLM